jgi:hypothetical protein
MLKTIWRTDDELRFIDYLEGKSKKLFNSYKYALLLRKRWGKLDKQRIMMRFGLTLWEGPNDKRLAARN